MKVETIICETHTGQLFNHAIMVCVRYINGSYGDLLYHADGEPMNLTTPEAKAISNYYNKKFTNE